MDLPSLEGVEVYCGCPISKEGFSVLEKMQADNLCFLGKERERCS